MNRLVLEWSGPAVKGLAVSVLHFTGLGGSPGVAAITSALALCNTLIPENHVIRVPNSGDIIDPSTGDLTGVWSDPAPAGQILGTGNPAAAAGVGACITWLTAGLENAHRVRGRTFFVPMATQNYEADGTLTATALGKLNTLGTTMAGLELAVWHRPTAVGGSDGSMHPVVSHKVSDSVAFLGSRRS